MKHFLALMAFAFALRVAPAQQLSPERNVVPAELDLPVEQYYFTGAWYCTKAPRPTLRAAGEMEVFLYADHSIYVQIWFNQNVVHTGSGSWRYTTVIGNVISATWGVTTPELNTFSGIFRSGFPFYANDFFGSGNYRQADGRYAGKWQVVSQ